MLKNQRKDTYQQIGNTGTEFKHQNLHEDLAAMSHNATPHNPSTP